MHFENWRTIIAAFETTLDGLVAPGESPMSAPIVGALFYLSVGSQTLRMVFDGRSEVLESEGWMPCCKDGDARWGTSRISDLSNLRTIVVAELVSPKR